MASVSERRCSQNNLNLTGSSAWLIEGAHTTLHKLVHKQQSHTPTAPFDTNSVRQWDGRLENLDYMRNNKTKNCMKVLWRDEGYPELHLAYSIRHLLLYYLKLYTLLLHH